MTRAHWSDLPRGHASRPLFKLAAIANADTIGGGASALYIARRAAGMGLPMAREFGAVVSEVYARSSGRVPDHLVPWRCDECGSVHADQDDAARCCAPDEWDQ